MKHPTSLWPTLVLAIGLAACNKAPTNPPPPPNQETPPPPPAASQADESPAHPPGAPGMPPRPEDGDHPKMNPEDRAKQHMEHMKESLGLTDEQTAKVQAIFESQRPAMQALFNDASLSREDRRARMMEIRQSIDSQLASILTPEQKAKWEEERAKRKDGPGRPPGGPDGGDLPPPPPQ